MGTGGGWFIGDFPSRPLEISGLIYTLLSFLPSRSLSQRNTDKPQEYYNPFPPSHLLTEIDLSTLHLPRLNLNSPRVVRELMAKTNIDISLCFDHDPSIGTVLATNSLWDHLFIHITLSLVNLGASFILRRSRSLCPCTYSNLEIVQAWMKDTVLHYPCDADPML